MYVHLANQYFTPLTREYAIDISKRGGLNNSLTLWTGQHYRTKHNNHAGGGKSGEKSTKAVWETQETDFVRTVDHLIELFSRFSHKVDSTAIDL